MPFTETAQLLGNLGEFAGAIAIVVTLGYLAVQIRQNNNLLASQARYNLFVRRSDFASSLQDRFLLESAHKYHAGEDVSGAELSAALLSALRTIEMWEWQYGEYDVGVLTREQLPVAAWRSWFHGQAQVPIPIKDVWLGRKGMLNPDFVKFMEENVVSR